MTPDTFVRLCRDLREMGALSVRAGDFAADFEPLRQPGPPAEAATPTREDLRVKEALDLLAAEREEMP